MYKAIFLILFSIIYVQELEVDGDLKVTGSIQNQTIDSLQQVIADLQSQLSALQGGNRLETRLFQVTGIGNGDVLNLLTNSSTTLPILDFYLIEIVNISGDVPLPAGGGDFEVQLSSANTSQIIRARYTPLGYTYLPIGGQSIPARNIFTNVEVIDVLSSPDTGSTYDLTISVTAQFPN